MIETNEINLNKSCFKSNLILALIFLIVSVSIILKSWFHPEGYLSPDSTGYLHLAKRILDGFGFTEMVYDGKLFHSRHAAVWPFGYPLAIAITSKVFGCSVFWASKVLNIFVVGAILVILQKMFKDRSPIFGLVLLSASFLEQFSYTLTEVPFILGMLLFASALYSFFNRTDKLWLPSLILFSSGMILFLSRYAGSFYLACLAVAFFYCLSKKDLIRTSYLGIVGVVSFCCIGSYLYYNFLITAFTSGMARIPSKETNLDLLINLFSATLNEMNILRHSYDGWGILFLFLFTQLLLLGIPFIKFRNELRIKEWLRTIKIADIPFIFCFVGISYCASIIYVRWKYHLDPFSFRLLGPGTILVFIAILYFVEKNFTENFKKSWFKTLCLLSLLSVLLNVPMKTYTQYQSSNVTYTEKVNKIKKALVDVDKGSIVLTWNRDLKYLRSDLIVILPSPYLNNLKSTKLSSFRLNIQNQYPTKKVYYFENQNQFSQYLKEYKQFTHIYRGKENNLFEIYYGSK